jgi:peptidoglycan/xylan/chitin deacetylase (PgdA/CDA1 family)
VSGLKKTIIRTGLESLYFSGAHLMMRPFLGGVGAILTLHHVRPPRPDRFQPNRLLEVTPAFLESVLRFLRRSGLDIVSLDEMHRRLTEGDFRRRFVCITIDDGYRDTLEWAYPILKRHAVPFTVYIPTSFPDRLGELWWLAIEAVVARNRHVSLLVDGVEQRRHDADQVESREEDRVRLAEAQAQPLIRGDARTRVPHSCSSPGDSSPATWRMMPWLPAWE